MTDLTRRAFLLATAAGVAPLGLSAAPRPAAAAPRPYGSVPIAGFVDPARPFVARLWGPRELVASYARRYGSARSDGASIQVDVHGYCPCEEGSPDAYRSSTWVIDFDQPKVRGLLGGARFSTPEDASVWVCAAIDKKNMSRGFDVASVVASRREGDCSEHAVLLAAVLRAQGIPARVVFGVYIDGPRAGDGAALEGFGHAWTEAWSGPRDGWRGVDATRPGAPVAGRHLAGASLDDESPGYHRGILAAVDASQPSRIVVAAR